MVNCSAEQTDIHREVALIQQLTGRWSLSPYRLLTMVALHSPDVAILFTPDC